MKYKKGFTLIELLVVIAIIGILSSVVLASLNTARGKGSNAAVKSDLKDVRNQAENFYDDNSTYVDVCLNGSIASSLDAASLAGTGVAGNYECYSDAISWVIQSPFKIPDDAGNTYWCLDNTGVARGNTAVLGGLTPCP